MPTVFQAESRTVRRFVGLPAVEKVQLWPTVDAILADARSRTAKKDIGDQIVFGALDAVLMDAIKAIAQRALGALRGVA